MEINFLAKQNGLEVTFQILSKIPVNYSISWDFGDDLGDTSGKKSIIHTYEEPGMYPVNVIVNDESGEEYGKGYMLLMLSDIVKTHLPDSIYNLIDEYIPTEIVEDMTLKQKTLYINKWQLYIQPLVNRSRGNEIPIEEYNNELYYEGLENQLIMELAVFDFLNVEISKLLTLTGEYLKEINSTKESEEGDPDNPRGEAIKKIVTGPTEIEYFDKISESISSLYKGYTQALKPGGILDELRNNLCTLAARLDIYLPFCSLIVNPVAPRVVNRRRPGPLGGPNPTAPLNK